MKSCTFGLDKIRPDSVFIMHVFTKKGRRRGREDKRF